MSKWDCRPLWLPRLPLSTREDLSSILCWPIAPAHRNRAVSAVWWVSRSYPDTRYVLHGQHHMNGISKSLFKSWSSIFPDTLSRLKKTPHSKPYVWRPTKKQCCFILLLYWSTQKTWILNPNLIDFPRFKVACSSPFMMVSYPCYGSDPLNWQWNRSFYGRTVVETILQYVYTNVYVYSYLRVYINTCIYIYIIQLYAWMADPPSPPAAFSANSWRMGDSALCAHGPQRMPYTKLHTYWMFQYMYIYSWIIYSHIYIYICIYIYVYIYMYTQYVYIHRVYVYIYIYIYIYICIHIQNYIHIGCFDYIYSWIIYSYIYIYIQYISYTYTVYMHTYNISTVYIY